MFGKRKLYPNEKADWLYSIIIFLIMVIIMMASAHFGFKFTLLMPFVPPAMMIPFAIREKKQFNKIGQIKELLGVSISEMQELSGASQYELTAWEKHGYYLTRPQLYRLEYCLDIKFEQEFGRPYEEYKKTLARKPL